MADHSFKAFVLDQLSALPDVRAKAMFGAFGIYSGEHFFGIVDDGKLFFKTDAQAKTAYEERGMKPFTYASQGKMLTMAYHEVPADILECAPELVTWAQRSIRIAADKPKKVKKPRA